MLPTPPLSLNAILDAVDVTCYPTQPGTIPVPSTLFIAAKIICRLHCLYCWRMEYSAVLTQTYGFRLYLLGNVVNVVAGSSKAVQIAAQMVLITRRVLTATQKTIVVYHAWNHLIITWMQHDTIEPSTGQTQWDLEQQRLLKKLSSLYSACVPLAFSIWELSAAYRLVIEAFSMNPAMRAEAVNMVFVNTAGVLDEYTTHRALLLELSEQQPLIQRILLFFKVNMTAKEWIDALGAHLQTADTARNIGRGVGSLMQDAAYRSWSLAKTLFGNRE